MQIVNQNIWIENKSGKFKHLNVAHDISLDFETNSIRFRIQATGFSHAYVLGRFNNWQKQESLKLTWTIDNDDGSFWLAIDVLSIPSLEAGTNQYTFILVDLDGNESKVSINDNSFIPLSFNWLTSNNKLEIKSSENFITPEFPLDLIAITETITKRKNIADVIWEISPKNPDIQIINNTLFVKSSLNKISEITIKCTSKNHPKFIAKRSFKVLKNTREGSIVHFIKKDNDYYGNNFEWDLWTFNDDKNTQAIALSEENDFGVYALCQQQNVIARKKIWDMHWHNDWAEQTNSFDISEKHNNYYIVHGDTSIYTSLTDVINRTNPRITFAVMDEPEKIMAYLSDIPLVGTSFELWINSQKVDASLIIKYKSKQLIFTNLPQNIQAADLIEIRANNTFLPTKVLMRNFLNNFYYHKNDMGVTFNKNNISLRLWAPTAKKVELLLYNEDLPTNKKQPDFSFELQPEPEFGTHHININSRDYENKYYLYRLYFDDLDPRGKHYTKVTYAIDPYATGLGVNGNKGFLINLNAPELTPNKWNKHKCARPKNKEDTIIYETHLRDFTISIESGIPQKLRGKFLGASLTGTSYIDNATGEKVSTGIDSLVELGITHIHLLPFFDFSSVDEAKTDDENNRNWGYDPKNYNAPDGCYSIDPYDPKQRIIDAREMIQGFHQQGIGVIMDVVYNHMTDTINLDKIVPKYYFRTDSFGNFTNGSGCGNELASEHPMVSKFIQDSIVHWVTNYKIDGIRFDLMELIDLDTIKSIVAKLQKIDPRIIVYGEPWKGGDSPITNGTYRGTQKNQNFSIFNDIFRDAIRGNNNPGNAFANNNPHNTEIIGNVIEGLQGSIHGLTANPIESINYVDAHDNYTLWDHIEKSQNHSIKNGHYKEDIPENIFESSLVRQNTLALGIILTAQGIPFIHGGAEFLRTKQGDHNSYRSTDKINAFHWSDKLTFKPFFDYVKGLIELRKEHPALRMSNSEIIKNSLNITTAHHDCKSGVIISHFKNHANNDNWKDIVIIYNATSIDGYDINDLLPKPESGFWHIVVNHENAGTKTLKKVSTGNLPTLRSYSILIIHS